MREAACEVAAVGQSLECIDHDCIDPGVRFLPPDLPLTSSTRCDPLNCSVAREHSLDGEREVPRPETGAVCAAGSGRGGDSVLFCPSVGQEGVDLSEGVGTSEPREDIHEVLAGVDAEQGARPEDGVHRGGPLRSGVTSREEVVLAGATPRAAKRQHHHKSKTYVIQQRPDPHIHTDGAPRTSLRARSPSGHAPHHLPRRHFPARRPAPVRPPGLPPGRRLRRWALEGGVRRWRLRRVRRVLPKPCQELRDLLLEARDPRTEFGNCRVPFPDDSKCLFQGRRRSTGRRACHGATFGLSKLH